MQQLTADLKRLIQASVLLAALPVLFLPVKTAAADSEHSGGHAHGVTSAFDNEKALAYSQAAIGRVISDYRLNDQDGREVDFTSYLGKPLLVSFIYTSCYHVCPLITTNLKKTVEIAQEALGEDSFSVVSIGFDTDVDTPERMRIFASERGINDRHWDFLSGDADTIQRLSHDLGFIYFPSPRGFDHLAQTTLIDAEGTVYRQIYGDKFDPRQLVEPLKELVYGTKSRLPVSLNDWINNIRLFCTVYDPATGRYTFDYSIIMTLITGLISLGIILYFVIHLWRTGKSF